MGNRRKTPAQRASRKLEPAHAPAAGSIVIGYLHAGQISAYFTQSILGTVLYDRVHGRRVAGILNEWSSANVSNARNKIVTQFLEGYAGVADWLLFIDSDMGWDPNAHERLLAVADPAKAPIVGGLCFGTSEDALFPTIYSMGALKDERPITMRLLDYPEDTMLRCAATGAAFVLIHRTVLEQMREAAFNPAFPWFQETELSGQPCSEDITFCLRAGLLGMPVHVHTGVHIGHHKSHLLTRDKFRAQTPISEEEAT
ncbi:MAG TPA: hypothetical protein VIU37_05665 [Candidatus Limnocylindrales bacterium]